MAHPPKRSKLQIARIPIWAPYPKTRLVHRPGGLVPGGGVWPGLVDPLGTDTEVVGAQGFFELEAVRPKESPQKDPKGMLDSNIITQT